MSDATCTALQLTNHWQDVRRDLIERDRVYLPSEETGLDAEALRDFLPAEIIKKQKHGFGLPFGTWACSHAGLKRLSSETLGSFEPSPVREASLQSVGSDLPAHPGYYGEMVWILMMLELWLQRQASDFRMVS